MAEILDWNYYTSLARLAAAEGCVLLKNDNNALPLEDKCRIAVFGRIQLHYYKSGTGSGGLVNVDKVYGITDGLIECGADINSELLDKYKSWDEENPFDNGCGGWGTDPWSQKEMPLDDDFVKHIADNSDAAVVVIGRSAGEDRDSADVDGSYRLSAGEEDMLKKVRASFGRMIVALNIGGIMDMSFIDSYSPDAVICVWQGGMVGGLGAADALTGKVIPSGRLTDTAALSVGDYPSDKYFGNRVRNFYSEDIYVGYRYFETFAKEKVRFPFGFGLSYTEFSFSDRKCEFDGHSVKAYVKIKNTGLFKGKETVMLFVEAPQGRLGKPVRTLAAFAKTKLLDIGEEQLVTLKADISVFASFDDSGCTGNKDCFVLEAGKYTLYLGTDVRAATELDSFTVEYTLVLEQLSDALAPCMKFERIRPEACSDGRLRISVDTVPVCSPKEEQRRLANIPDEITYTGDVGIKLRDAACGKSSMDSFIAQLSDNDLACIARGEGMGSPQVTPGTAAAFGGVTDSLKSFGIPAACCTDGPSGMRLDCGTKAFSLPNGTLLASTFDEELIERLYGCLGLEMASNKIECLLGPGMNIHRHPLNGRNFEYFSEDPLVTGKIASAMLRGMAEAGVTGTIKHFCANNQETCRREIDSVVSERALREIYLKGFEIAVKEGGASSIMTTYGAVNGLWTAGSYDLTTTILRKEWGFKGIAMTDWWANISTRECCPVSDNLASMIMAQNDLYMVRADSSADNDNILSKLSDDGLSRGEMQRVAENICNFVMSTRAMKRLDNPEYAKAQVEIVNRPYENNTFESGDVEFIPCDGDVTLPLESVEVKRGESYVFGLDVSKNGFYEVTITASSESGELAQIPVSLYVLGGISGVFTWNGTNGKPISITRNNILLFSRFSTMRLYFAQSGLKLISIHFKFTKPLDF